MRLILIFLHNFSCKLFLLLLLLLYVFIDRDDTHLLFWLLLFFLGFFASLLLKLSFYRILILKHLAQKLMNRVLYLSIRYLLLKLNGNPANKFQKFNVLKLLVTPLEFDFIADRHLRIHK